MSTGTIADTPRSKQQAKSYSNSEDVLNLLVASITKQSKTLEDFSKHLTELPKVARMLVNEWWPLEMGYLGLP